MMKRLSKKQLQELRQDVILGSLYIEDYTNRFNFNPSLICNFFDGYLDELQELMQENIKNYNDELFFDYLKYYDNIYNLYNYYNSLENDCLKCLFIVEN